MCDAPATRRWNRHTTCTRETEGERAGSTMGDFQAPALQVLWQAVTSDPMNFQSWTALLSQVKLHGYLPSRVVAMYIPAGDACIL